MTTLPDPLVPAEVDLTGYEFMPLYGERLFNSDLKLEASPLEFRTALRLWWKAWTQVPAASLPSSETSLCQLAGFESLASWRKVREQAMRNFILCSDGRYYHTFLAPLAMDAWAARLAARVKGQNGARKRWGSKAGAVDNRARATENRSPGHEESMPQLAVSDATATKNHSKGEGSLSKTSISRGESVARSPDADPRETGNSKSKQAHQGQSTREASLVAAGARKGLTARPGESSEEFESRVRTTRA